MTQPTNAQLAANISALLSRWNAREAEFRDWLAGTPSGGPNHDGRYPLTNASGETFLLACPAKLASTVDGPAVLADTARAQAEAAKATAQGYRDSARDDATVATGSKVAAQDAATLAKIYRDDAAASAAALGNSRQAVASDRESTLLARDEATQARDDAVSAKNSALTARSEAVTARDQAQGYAASINPANLATKADLAAEVAKLVGQSPSTLDTLQELAVALGNNPNFATTMTTQLAGKASVSHTHGIADITGLQTALDGKQPVGSYVASSAFTWANLSGKPTAFTPSAHTHAITDVTGLQSALDGKLGLTGGTLTGLLVGRTNTGGSLGASNDTGSISVRGDANNAAVISFHRPGLFAVNMGLDTDNTFRIGGWSFGGTSLTLTSAGVLSVPSDVYGRDFTASRGDGTGAVFLNGARSRYLYFDGGNYIMPGAELYVNGTRVWRSGTIDTNTWHSSGDGKNRFYFANQGRSYYGSANGHEWRSAADQPIFVVANDGLVDAFQLLTVRSTGNSAGVRFYNNSAGRDWRMIQKDNGQLMVTHETAGAEVLRCRVDNWVEVPYGIVSPNVSGGHSGSFSGDITWNPSVNIYVPGESSFDLQAGAVWSVWDGNYAIRVTQGQQVTIGEAAGRGLGVVGPLNVTGDAVAGGLRVARVVSSAVGGGRIFRSDTQPSGMVEGDIWLKPL